MRMSEFGNLIDERELVYAASTFKEATSRLDIQILQDLKENVFCLSACEANDETRKDLFMWEQYGDNGKGATIEYSFTNKNSFSHIFGKIQYGDSNLEPLRKIESLSESWKNGNDGFFPNNFTELLLEIQAFHKEQKHEKEQEVRLLLKVDKPKYQEHNDQGIYQDINSRHDVKYFNKIFINGKHSILTKENVEKVGEERLLRIYPQIEIQKITLGFALTIEQKVALYDFFSKIKTDNKYEFEICQIHENRTIVNMI